MTLNQLTAPQDPSGTGPYNQSSGVANCVLQCMAVQRVFLATFSIAYASVPATAFVGHGMQAGDVVIVVGTDLTHVWTMGVNGARDVVYQMATRSHATRDIDNDPPWPQPRENLRALPNGPVWLFETCDLFASITADQFTRRIPGGSVVICKCFDRTRTVVLDLNCRIATVY